MKLSHLNGLRALESTLRNGTFTAAAKEMGVTVAAVGQQIRGLEEYIGIKLFDRLPQGALPTADARAVADRLTTGFTHIEDVLEELKGVRSQARLYVSMSYRILDHWLSERMGTLHNLLPETEIRFETGEDYADLFSGDFDMAVRFSPVPGPEYAFDEIYKGYMLPVCTPQCAEKFKLTPKTRNLSGVPLFRLHDGTQDPAWIGWDTLFDVYGMRRDGAGPVEHISGLGAARSGAGLMLSGLTESYADLISGKLVAPLGPAFVRPFSYGYRLVWPAGRRHTRPMKIFREWLLEERDLYLANASEVLGRELT